MDGFRYRYDVHNVFEDFLTLTMCAVTRNPASGKSHYEDLYMDTIAKYAKDEIRHDFPKMFTALVEEMEERVGGDTGNDVLGEYYELHLAKKGKSQFFTPWPICEFMSKSSIEAVERTDGKPLRILEPACGSGRMLLSVAKHAGPHNEFYAVDLDHTCVKMTAINLFLNGVFNSEVMCADFLFPDNFQISYVISFLPIGIFRIEEKENSRLWNIMQNTLEANRKEASEKKKKPFADIKLPSESGGVQNGNASQLQLF